MAKANILFKFEKILLENVDSESYAKEHNILQISDTNELEKIVDEVIANNSKASDDVKNGEMKAIGFLVGQVMKLSGGKANPETVQQMINERLG